MMHKKRGNYGRREHSPPPLLPPPPSFENRAIYVAAGG
jgi:hypothetical protein